MPGTWDFAAHQEGIEDAYGEGGCDPGVKGYAENNAPNIGDTDVGSGREILAVRFLCNGDTVYQNGSGQGGTPPPVTYTCDPPHLSVVLICA